MHADSRAFEVALSTCNTVFSNFCINLIGRSCSWWGRRVRGPPPHPQPTQVAPRLQRLQMTWNPAAPRPPHFLCGVQKPAAPPSPRRFRKWCVSLPLSRGLHPGFGGRSPGVLIFRRGFEKRPLVSFAEVLSHWPPPS